MRGRFFQSVKSILPDPGFTVTRINGKPFSAADLVAVMLRCLRERAGELTGTPITRAVLGRPARFSDEADRERVAHERLEQAAEQAGFTHVEFELEPVAGARAFAARADGATLRGATVFVAGYGGGTSDFTVMELAVDSRGRPAAGSILATHGIRAGGDDFDAAIMWHRIVDQFGHGSHFESFGKWLPVPVHIFHIISRSDQIHFLKTLAYREELRTYLRMSDNPLAIRRLIKLVEEDLGHFIVQAIERAKIDLSTVTSASVDYESGKLRMHETITRAEFDAYIADHVTRIAEAVDQTLHAASRASADRVFLTGGSSRVAAVRAVLAERFGEAALVDDADQFQSVSLGLALAARDRGVSVSPLATDVRASRTRSPVPCGTGSSYGEWPAPSRRTGHVVNASGSTAGAVTKSDRMNPTRIVLQPASGSLAKTQERRPRLRVVQ